MIRILNGNSLRLQALLGDLVQHVTIRLGDAIVDTDVEVSRAVFEKLLTQGYTAYQIKETGESKGPVYNFDPSAWKTIIFGPVGGG